MGLIEELLPTADHQDVDPSVICLPHLAYPEINGLAGRLNRHLKKGADPCVLVKGTQGHFMPLGMAASLLLDEAIEVLLEAGAWGAWPHRDIPSLELTGEEDVSYEGVLPDPLAEAARSLGWAADVGGEGRSARAIRAVQRLTAHACPLNADPATGRTPIEELFIALDDSMVVSQAMKKNLAHLVWQWIEPATPEEGIRWLAAGDPKVVSSATPVPGMLMDALSTHARQHLMERALPKSVARRVAPRL